jgi:hypothetical protein
MSSMLLDLQKSSPASEISLTLPPDVFRRLVAASRRLNEPVEWLAASWLLDAMPQISPVLSMS